MAQPPAELKRISLFLPRLFSLLGIVAASFPLIERLFGFLSKDLRYPNVAAVLAWIASFALIGSAFLKRRPVGQDEVVKAHEPLPRGRFMLLAGAVLILGYLGLLTSLNRRA